MKKLLLTCCALAVVAVSGPAMAKDAQKYAVKKIEYKNRGAYAAKFEVRFNVKNNAGKTVTCKLNAIKDGPGKFVQSSQNRTFKLGEKSHFNLVADNRKACDNFKNEDTKKNYIGYIPVGSEVWGRVQIRGGDSENCHKGNRVKFYFHPDGGTATYLSKGTTHDQNRCQLQSKGGVLWEDVQ